MKILLRGSLMSSFRGVVAIAASTSTRDLQPCSLVRLSNRGTRQFQCDYGAGDLDGVDDILSTKQWHTTRLGMSRFCVTAEFTKLMLAANTWDV